MAYQHIETSARFDHHMDLPGGYSLDPKRLIIMHCTAHGEDATKSRIQLLKGVMDEQSQRILHVLFLAFLVFLPGAEALVS